jgi:nucleoside-triphosphatase THEP1
MVTNGTIAQHLEVTRRYVRSTDLRRDLDDPEALDGYVVTATAREAVLRITHGLRRDSKQRAFRITGPYGVGKSTVALLLAKLLRGDGDAARIAAPVLTASSEPPRYEPIVLNGRRASFVDDLLDATGEAAARLGATDLAARVAHIRAGHDRAQPALAALENLAVHLLENEGRGLLLIVDEMGRYLEFAASHPRLEDPSVFQALAERAGGRGRAPLAVVTLLHHRFSDYVAGLGEWIEAEWSRTAERYEEISFRESAEQTLFLLSHALTSVNGSATVTKRARAVFAEAGKRGLFHTAADELRAMAPRLFPLHPASVAALSAMARRFGQNERSVFGFLQSHEPYGFRDHLERTDYGPNGWFLLPRLFDYLAAQGELRLRAPDRERRWQLALDALVQADGLPPLDTDTLKAVAVIAVLGPLPGLRTDADSIAWCLGVTLADAEAALARLAARRILYRRPHRDDYSLWSSTSVDLDHWIDEARIQVPAITRLDGLASGLPPARPIVAHRHYHQTGTLRTFSVVTVEAVRDGDGAIVVLPLHPDQDEAAALSDAAERSRTAPPLTLFCVQRIEAADLKWAHELAMWRWISETCEELRVDDLARGEVAARLAAAETALGRTLGGLARPSVGERSTWFDRGRRLELSTAAELSRHLSDMLDETFYGAPVLRNELINRSRLSTAVASARMRLLELMVTSADQHYLGLEGAPPERTIYLAMFDASGMHRPRSDGGYEFARPDPDPLNWAPAWDRVGQLVQEAGLVRFDHLVSALGEAPYGLCSGPALLLIGAYMLANRRDIALMERGTFQPELTGSHFMRLAKSPGNFALRHLGEADDRRQVLERLAAELVVFDVGAKPEAALKPIVEGLYLWWRRLPEYTLATRSVTAGTDAVRSVLAKGREPVDLIFSELPRACGALLASGEIDATLLVERLNVALLELADAEPMLRSMASAALAEAFGVRDLAGVHEQVRVDYAPHRLSLRDFTLRQFVERMLAPEGERRWLEGVTGLLGGRRIDGWTDESLDTFAFEARSVAERLARWLMAIRKAVAQKSDLRTVHVVSTSGEEQSMVVRAGDAPRSSAQVEAEMRKLLEGRADAGAILGRLLVERMPEKTKEENA